MPGVDLRAEGTEISDSGQGPRIGIALRNPRMGGASQSHFLLFENVWRLM
jgi:hypothetical protein